MASIGGTATLRGYRRERFWGKTAFYNQNELQYLMPFRSYWFNGTVGPLALFDAGRVWQPGEVSDKLHTGYGAGLLVSPFQKLVVSLAYARSEERGMFHIGLRGRL
jgi:hemolysin activation/secretion protein